MSERLSLAGIMSRHVEIHSFEAVAVARALAGHVAQDDPGRSTFPGLDEVFLTSSGDLVLEGSSFAGDARRWIGSVLQMLVASAEPPVQLRLVILQATSGAPGTGTLGELDGVLAYFERPNRQGVLQNLYARAVEAAVNAVAPPPVLAPVAPNPVPTRPIPRVKRPTRRMSTAVVGATVALCALGAAAYYVAARRPELVGAGSAASQKAGKALGDAFLAGMSSVTEVAGLGRLVPPDAPPSPLPAGTPPRSDVRLPEARTRGARKPEPIPVEPVFTAFDLDSSPSVFDAVPPPPAIKMDPAPPDRDPEPDDVVYGTGAEGVAPPIGLRPKLARELPATMRPEELTRIELVIGTTGAIESARLLDPPGDVIDSMIVSAAKAWEFEPAIKNGRPVRYRKTVWIRAR